MYNNGTHLLFEVIVVDKVKQFAMPLLQKAKDFLVSCSYPDLVIMGVIVLIPVLAIILAIASKKSRRRSRRQNVVYVERPVRMSRRERNYYKPRKRRVRYIKTKASKVFKRRAKQLAKQKTVYCKLDQSTLLATGLFGVGLWMMAHKAALDEKKNLYW